MCRCSQRCFEYFGDVDGTYNPFTQSGLSGYRGWWLGGGYAILLVYIQRKNALVAMGWDCHRYVRCIVIINFVIKKCNGGR